MKTVNSRSLLALAVLLMLLIVAAPVELIAEAIRQGSARCGRSCCLLSGSAQNHCCGSGEAEGVRACPTKAKSCRIRSQQEPIHPVAPDSSLWKGAPRPAVFRSLRSPVPNAHSEAITATRERMTIKPPDRPPVPPPRSSMCR